MQQVPLMTCWLQGDGMVHEHNSIPVIHAFACCRPKPRSLQNSHGVPRYCCGRSIGWSPDPEPQGQKRKTKESGSVGPTVPARPAGFSHGTPPAALSVLAVSNGVFRVSRTCFGCSTALLYLLHATPSTRTHPD